MEHTTFLINGIEPIIGVSRSSSDSYNVLVTHKTKGVDCWDVKNRVIVSSYSQPPGSSALTTPAAFHSSSQSIFCARNNQLIAWDTSSSSTATEHLSKTIRTSSTFKTSIQSILNLEPNDEACVSVVLKNGSILRRACVTSSLEPRAESQSPSNANVIWSSSILSKTSSQSIILLALEKEEAEGRVVTSIRAISTGNIDDLQNNCWGKLFNEVEIRESNGEKAISCALFEATLALLFADGNWITFSVKTDVIGNELRLKLIKDRVGNICCFDLKHPIVFDFAGRKDVFLVSGVLSTSWAGKSGVPPNGTKVVMAIETLYNTASSIKELTGQNTDHIITQLISVAGKSPNNRVPNDMIAVIVYGNSGNVDAIDIHIENVSLKSAIASGLSVNACSNSNNRNANNLPPLSTIADILPLNVFDNQSDDDDEEKEQEKEQEQQQQQQEEDFQLRSEILNTKKWNRMIRRQNENEEIAIAKISDLNTSAGDVKKLVNFLLISGKPALSNSTTTTTKEKKKSKKNKIVKVVGREAISFNFVQSLAKRVCIESNISSFWQPMHQLLKLKVVTYSETPELISRCIDRNYLRGIKDCLRYLKDIPDEEITRLLKYVISEVKEKTLKLFISTNRKLNKETTTTLAIRKYFLTLVINLSRNEVFAHKYIKPLTTTEVTFLLGFLSEWLKRIRTTSEQTMKNTPELLGVIPITRQITGWIETVLDAHVGTLVLLQNECYQPLIEINKYLHEELDLCQKAKELEPYLEQISHPSSFPHQQISEYQIEVVRF